MTIYELQNRVNEAFTINLRFGESTSQVWAEHVKHVLGLEKAIELFQVVLNIRKMKHTVSTEFESFEFTRNYPI